MKNFRMLVKLVVLKLTVACAAAMIIIPSSIAVNAYFSAPINGRDEIIRYRDEGLILLDRKGRRFFSFGNTQKKEIVDLESVSPFVVKTLLASEDREFYQHNGFSWKGIIRAIYLDVKKRRFAHGGSTITQQLVKNTLHHGKKDLQRKVEEIAVAWKLEQKFSKDEILEMYLNTVYFGSGAYGIEQAANNYFAKKASDLSLAEASFLISRLKAPSANLGDVHNPLFLAQQKIILKQAREAGYISETEEREALTADLAIIERKPENIIAPHFALMVKDEIEETIKRKPGENRLLTVTTTLDLDWQKETEKELKERIEAIKRFNAGNGALVAIDPKTGQIISLAGSADWHDELNGKINMATHPRQTGSSFKPIVYATAFSRRLMTPATMIDDTKTVFSGNYEPKNYDRRYHGRVTVRTALANSLNIPAVKVAQNTGTGRIVEQAALFGIDNLSQFAGFNLSTALGSEEISLLEMTGAYAALADNGTYREPTLILRITDKKGNDVALPKKTVRQAVTPEAAYLVTSILSDRSARRMTFGRMLDTPFDAAVKTGTTESYRDAWTMGYTANIALGTWIGNNDNSRMQGMAAVQLTAPLWKDVMGSFVTLAQPDQFVRPNNIITATICRVSGLLATEESGPGYRELFIAGTEPRGYCQPLPKEEDAEKIEVKNTEDKKWELAQKKEVKKPVTKNE